MAGGFPSDTPLLRLGEDDNAAMFTPVLLSVFSGTSASLGLSFSGPSFFVGPFFLEADFALFLDLEDDVVEVDLSSPLVLLIASFSCFTLGVGASKTLLGSVLASLTTLVVLGLG